MDKRLTGIWILCERRRCWVVGRWEARLGHETRTVDWEADNWVGLQNDALQYLETIGADTVNPGRWRAPEHIARRARCNTPPPDVAFTW